MQKSMGHHEGHPKSKEPTSRTENSNNIMTYFKDLEKQEQSGGGTCF